MPRCFRILRPRATLVWREQVLEYKTTTVTTSVKNSYIFDANPPCPESDKMNPLYPDPKQDPDLNPKTTSGSGSKTRFGSGSQN